MSDVLEEILGGIWALALEVLGLFFSAIGTLLHFFLWLLAGVFILPCVFVAGTFYPMWEKWGEKF